MHLLYSYCEIEWILELLLQRNNVNVVNYQFQAPHVPDEHVFALESRLLELSRKTGHGVEVLKKLGYAKWDFLVPFALAALS